MANEMLSLLGSLRAEPGELLGAKRKTSGRTDSEKKRKLK